MGEFPVTLTGERHVVVQGGEIVEELELTPEQAAIRTYQFVCADLAEGLEYQVSAEMYNDSMEAVGSNKRVESSVGSRRFAEDLYAETRE